MKPRILAEPLAENRFKALIPSIKTIQENQEILILFKNAIRAIKDAKASSQWYLSGDNYIENTARDAILYGKIELLKVFLDEGLPPDSKAYREDGYTYPLIAFASRLGRLDFVRLLVERGASVARVELPYNNRLFGSQNQGNDWGMREAVLAGHTEIVKYLLESGASGSGLIGGNAYQDTFITVSALHGRIEMLELLMLHGAASSNELKESLSRANDKYSEHGEWVQIDYLRRLQTYYTDKHRKNLVNDITSKPTDEYYKQALKEFNDNRATLKDRIIKETQANYKRIVRTLMDYAVGFDLTPTKWFNLNFLKSLSTISGINFVGTSITREMLAAEKLEGAATAIVTLDDLAMFPDISRRGAIQQRLQTFRQNQGLLIRNGVVIAMPLWRAAQLGDIEVVNTRLTAGVNPNETIPSLGENLLPPIVHAAKHGHEAIVIILCNHPLFDVKSLPLAIKFAKESGHLKLAEKLIAIQQDLNQIDANDKHLLHSNVEEEKEEVKAEINKDRAYQAGCSESVTTHSVFARKRIDEAESGNNVLKKNREVRSKL